MEWNERDLIAIEDAASTESGSRGRHRPPARSRWDHKHMTTMTTKVRRRDAREIRAYCQINGTTVYHLLHKYLMDWLRQQRQLWS